MIGGGGEDVMTGGGGLDAFVLRPGGTVTVTDWGAGGRDLLALDDRFLGIGDAGVDVRAVTRGQAEGALRTGQVSYDAATGALRVDADRAAGPRDPVLIAVLEGGGALAIDDVLLF
jgi:hypothetical protein